VFCSHLLYAAGGFLACNLTARHPDAVKGLVLLNATPFWSSRPPAGHEGLLWKLLPSTVPVPKVRLVQSMCYMC
jgi:pimeloyl-ACP methyl ester carboxylesterase